MSADPSDDSSVLPTHDPYAALRIPSYRHYLSGNFLALLGVQMQATAIAWEVVNHRNLTSAQSTTELIKVAMLQFLPVLFFGIPAGQLADRYPRKLIVSLSLVAVMLGSVGLAWFSWTKAPIEWMYLCLLVNGIAKAASQPAKGAMLPLLVPRECFTNAVTWNSTTFELAVVSGPGLAGLLIALWELPAIVYALEATSSLIFLLLLFRVEMRPQTFTRKAADWNDFFAGMRFVFRHKIILGTISLDLFAVLLGGAITLLPIYAKDVLHVGPIGFGTMRAIPSVGALCTAFAVAHMGPMRRAGRVLLWSVAGFGIATILFGYSRDYAFSLFMLFLTGVFDNVSVQVRQSLIQLLTPDEMRGRVSAVNGIFIGASNELGGAESATVAAMFGRENDPTFGPTVSVVSGGIGTLVVVGLIAWLFPGVRNYGRLDGSGETHEVQPAPPP